MDSDAAPAPAKRKSVCSKGHVKSGPRQGFCRKRSYNGRKKRAQDPKAAVVDQKEVALKTGKNSTRYVTLYKTGSGSMYYKTKSGTKRYVSNNWKYVQLF